MKVISRSRPGYDPQTINKFYNATHVELIEHNEPVRPPAVCFQGDKNVFELAANFCEKVWYHAEMVYFTAEMTDEMWRAFAMMIGEDIAYNNAVAYLMCDIDQLSPTNQSLFANLLRTKPFETWIITVGDHRRLIPELLSLCLVYLGMDEKDHMQFLAQDGHIVNPD